MVYKDEKNNAIAAVTALVCISNHQVFNSPFPIDGNVKAQGFIGGAIIILCTSTEELANHLTQGPLLKPRQWLLAFCNTE